MTKAIPILRIFDYAKAIEFYVNWPGFHIDWAHQPAATPLYMQVSLGSITLHLSEHHGDSSPGARVFIEGFQELYNFHEKLTDKAYRYNRPGLEVPFYDPAALEMTVTDPFSNRLTFVERKVSLP